MKRYFTEIYEMQSKTRCPFHPIKLPKIKKFDQSCYCQGHGQLGPLTVVEGQSDSIGPVFRIQNPDPRKCLSFSYRNTH